MVVQFIDPGTAVTGAIVQGGVTASVTDRWVFLDGDLVNNFGNVGVATVIGKVNETQINLNGLFLNNIVGDFDDFNTVITAASGNLVNGSFWTYTHQYAISDISIDQDGTGRYMYANLTGANTSARPSVDATNWGLIPPSVANGYSLQECETGYDIVSDVRSSRRQAKTSTLGEIYAEGNGGDLIPFGWANFGGIQSFGQLMVFDLFKPNAFVTNLIIRDNATFQINEFNGDIDGVEIKESATFSNIGLATDVIRWVTCEASSYIVNLISSNFPLSNFKFEAGSSIDGNSLYSVQNGSAAAGFNTTLTKDCSNEHLGYTGFFMQKYSLPYTLFQTAGLTKTVNIPLPNGAVSAIVLKTTQAFAGAGIATCVMNNGTTMINYILGSAGSIFIADYDLLVAPSGINAASSVLVLSLSDVIITNGGTSNGSIDVVVTSTGANLDQLNSGSFDLTLWISYF